MGKARALGNNAQIVLISQSTLLPISLGELDNFKAKSRTTVSQSRPVGYVNTQTTLNYGGWDLSFETGKVDWALAHYMWLQDNKLRQNKLPPVFAILQTINHYNGAIEQYIYKNTVLHGLEVSIPAQEEMKETHEAFAPIRTLGIIDTTIIADPIGNLAREAIMRFRPEILESALGPLANIERPF